MKKFDDWWHSIYADKPKMIHRQCYEEGYAQRSAEVNAALLIAFSASIIAVIVCLFIF